MVEDHDIPGEAAVTCSTLPGVVLGWFLIQVAALANIGCARKLPVNVAALTFQLGVLTDQRKKTMLCAGAARQEFDHVRRNFRRENSNLRVRLGRDEREADLRFGFAEEMFPGDLWVSDQLGKSLNFGAHSLEQDWVL